MQLKKYDRQTVYTILGVFVLFTAIAVKSSDFSFLQKQSTETIKKPNIQESAIVISGTENNALIEKPLSEYVEITGGCGAHFEEECLNVRSGPGTEYPVINRLRNGIVLEVEKKVENNGHAWYKIAFNEWLRYPERVASDWYIDSDFVRLVTDEGPMSIEGDLSIKTNKKIIVERSTQTLYAYENDVLFMEEKISTGLELTPTPRGQFAVFRKTPSRYMQGPIPEIAEQYYDLPGVPWNLYFTLQGAVIHGAYWHTSFGKEYSHGCVNLPPDKAEKLYNWADLGTVVIVRD